MTRITTLLVVLTLTGSPAASILCLGACEHQAATAGSCHEHMAGGSAAIVTADAACAVAAGDNPFVKDDRSLGTNGMIVPAAMLHAPAPVPVVDHHSAIASATSGWLTPPFVLRL